MIPTARKPYTRYSNSLCRVSSAIAAFAIATCNTVLPWPSGDAFRSDLHQRFDYEWQEMERSLRHEARFLNLLLDSIDREATGGRLSMAELTRELSA